MSREIKFRAWDTDANKMLELLYMRFDKENPESIQLMQYTGLKDKNDVEIYEGDIVKGYYDEFDPYFEETNRHVYTSRVIYIDNAFCVNRDTVNEEGRIRNYGYQKDWDSETIKVIGNIYSNPELLEASK